MKFQISLLLSILVLTTNISIPTPHINAKKGDFAETVLMPGDPKRAKFVADKFLENPVLVNDIRGIQGFTGTYKGKRVSVMASGMGMPSMGIYSYELFSAYDVKNIIRVGSAGSLNKNIHIKDIVVGVGASTNSNFAETYGLSGTIAAIASFDLLKKADFMAKKLGLDKKTRFGNILSTDNFYGDAHTSLDWTKMGILAVEMEANALYLTAARLGKNALSICQISDEVLTGIEISSDERQSGFDEMILLALEIAIMED